MLATALQLSEAQIDAMTWDHYQALCEHWRDSPPAQFILAAWLRSVRR